MRRKPSLLVAFSDSDHRLLPHFPKLHHKDEHGCMACRRLERAAAVTDPER
jgi:hypothetical protein